MDVSGNEETSQTVVYNENTIDYSPYFENLQIIGFILCAVLIGCTISICFFKGLSK